MGYGTEMHIFCQPLLFHQANDIRIWKLLKNFGLNFQNQKLMANIFQLVQVVFSKSQSK
jgi:hypothetical protein